MKTSERAARKPGLLDVNVLIALIFADLPMPPAHEFHAAAHTWFQRNRRHGWLSRKVIVSGPMQSVFWSQIGSNSPGLVQRTLLIFIFCDSPFRSTDG
jgi:hypothetical protein